jgi:hypothetical protein
MLLPSPGLSYCTVKHPEDSYPFAGFLENLKSLQYFCSNFQNSTPTYITDQIVRSISIHNLLPELLSQSAAKWSTGRVMTSPRREGGVCTQMAPAVSRSFARVVGTSTAFSWNYGHTNLKQCISCSNGTRLQEFSNASGFVVSFLNAFMCFGQLYFFFSNETLFWLIGFVTRQNSRLWTAENPQAVCQKPSGSVEGRCVVRRVSKADYGTIDVWGDRAARYAVRIVWPSSFPVGRIWNVVLVSEC